MKIPESVLKLIDEEQKRQNGNFIPSDTSYLEKLSQHAELLIHQKHNEILGFVFFYCNAPDKKISYITLIGTNIKHRGQGVGLSLLNYVLTISKQRGFSQCQLEVRKENKHANAFYQKAGFFFTEDRENKFLMSIQLH